MISNRRGARRSASPVERLREFAINTSKGIDITQAPVNNDTVVHAKNLIVNPDGSLSLRKPLTCTNSIPYAYIPHVLFDGNFLLEHSNHRELETARGEDGWEDTVGTIHIDLSYYDYTGKEHLIEDFADDGILSIFKKSDFKFINLNTATIIGGCNIDLDYDGLQDLVNPSLYDGVDTVPRYLKITHTPTADGSVKYLATILSPMPNELRFGTDGELALDPNIVLDNPYAIKDVYGATYPNSKGVVGYGYSTLQNETPVSESIPTYGSTVSQTVRTPLTSKTFSTPSMESVSSTVPYEHTLVIQHKLSIGYSVETALDIELYNQDSGSDYGYWIGGRFTGTVTISPMFESAKVDRGGGAVAESPSAFVRVRIKTYDSSGVLTNNILHPISVSTQGFNLTDGDVALDKVEIPLEFSDTTYLWQSASSSSKHEVTVELVEGFVSMSVESRRTIDVTCLDLDTVAQLTESVKNTRFRPVVSTQDIPVLVLKAFGNVPLKTGTISSYWATWYATYDGVTWVPVTFPNADPSTYRMVADADGGSAPFAAYYPFAGTDSLTPLRLSGNVYENRPDILPIVPEKGYSPLQYKFRVITLSDNTLTDVSDRPTYETKDLISEVFYTVPFYGPNEFAHIEIANAVYGNKLYYKKRIYSYGHEKFFNNIFVSDIDNFETPLYNIIDIDAKQSDTVSVVIPWRDYLMSATSNSIYLHTPQDNGFLTKTVTTSLGIPKEDSQCCVSVLNGVVTKSGSKIYLIYPNVYSGTDDVLNVAPISQPVDEYLQIFEDYFKNIEDSSKHNPFAFSTESEYILMLPFDNKTMCLRYNYTTRIWCMCEYPVRLYDYRINNVEDIRLYGILTGGGYAEFRFDAEVEVDADSDGNNYVDVIGTEKKSIEFEWDSGQKTDNIATRKQFVESKIAFTTEDAIEDFPMELIVAVDGDPNLVRVDVRTDAPLIKTEGSVGVLGTQIRASEGDASIGVSNRGLVRHLIVRYSGRGRSVRHVLTGTAKSPFRLYEAYIRYKLLDNKR